MRFYILLLAFFYPLAAVAQEASVPAKGSIEAQELAPQPPDQSLTYNAIVLQGLNKVTGHISRLEGALGTVMRFGTLEIIARKCWKSNPEEMPENAAMLEILELKPGEAPARIFLGWMFSSTPGLSGLEHPVYDITVLACESHQETEEEAEKE